MRILFIFVLAMTLTSTAHAMREVIMDRCEPGEKEIFLDPSDSIQFLDGDTLIWRNTDLLVSRCVLDANEIISWVDDLYELTTSVIEEKEYSECFEYPELYPMIIKRILLLEDISVNGDEVHIKRMELKEFGE